MSEYAFDDQGREWFIPPCVKEIRLASDGERTTRNPHQLKQRSVKDFKLISYDNGYDGGMLITCGGKEDCPGGTFNVDRHDLIQPRMPNSTNVFREICTSQDKFYSDHGFVRGHVDLDFVNDEPAVPKP